MSNKKPDQIKALKLHIKYALPIIKNILDEVGYSKNQIKKISEIVLAHKFKNPRNFDKRLFIDADALSDVFREQFYSDVKAYKTTPQKLYNFRKYNKFYTKKAEEILNKELEKRKREIQK